MNKIITLLIVSLFATTLWAQAPQKMSYQAVIRNASNALVANSNIRMRISVLQGTATGTAVYVETQTATTNLNGLATIEIGAGTVVSGTFATIAWGTNAYFIKTETDPSGGTNYSIVGTSQFLSVPYALFASSGNAGPAGPQGPIGLTGAAGAQGLAGVAGSPGANGAVGATGPAGPQGAAGPQGIQGIPGTAGAANISGTVNKIVKFGTATTGVDSQMSDDGTIVKIQPNGYTGYTVGNTKVEISGSNSTLRLNGTGNFGQFARISFGDGERVFVTEDEDDALQLNSLGRTALTGGFVGVGTLTPAERLDVNGKTKTTRLQVTAGAAAGRVLTSDATGNATWQTVGGASGWSLTGNAGTNPSTNFIGTTDNTDIVFSRNNTKAGRIGADNIAFGDRALNSLTTGLYNSAYGRIALFSNTTADYNTAMGASSLFANTIGTANTVVGYNALSAGTSVSQNVAIGVEALKSSTTSGQVAVGYMALTSNTSGQLNTALGYESLKTNLTGTENTAAGYQSLK